MAACAGTIGRHHVARRIQTLARTQSLYARHRGARARRQPPHGRLLRARREADSARRRARRPGSRAGVTRLRAGERLPDDPLARAGGRHRGEDRKTIRFGGRGSRRISRTAALSKRPPRWRTTLRRRPLSSTPQTENDLSNYAYLTRLRGFVVGRAGFTNFLA